MGHYDAQYEDRFEEERKQRLRSGRKTIVGRLTKLSNSMDTLGIKGSDIINEAIEHLNKE